nr:hypothetical protein [Morchella crassipes]
MFGLVCFFFLFFFFFGPDSCFFLFSSFPVWTWFFFCSIFFGPDSVFLDLILGPDSCFFWTWFFFFGPDSFFLRVRPAPKFLLPHYSCPLTPIVFHYVGENLLLALSLETGTRQGLHAWGFALL